MSAYLLVKWLHILSSVVIVGTGFGTAFYLYFSNRGGNVEAIAEVSRLVVRADTWFTAPAVIFQPLSGFWLIWQGGWDPLSNWIVVSVVLFVLTGACWLPVLWLQLRLRDMARNAKEHGRPLPEDYWRFARRWERLGYPAFAMMIMVFFLMVNKSL